MNALPTPADCCTTCTDPISTNVPGPSGAAGANGSNGTNGLNAFSLVSGGSTLIPAYGASVDLPLANPPGSQWMANTQIIHIESTGYFRVDFLPDASTATIFNLGYAGNVNGNGILTFTAGARVQPGGLEGPSGAAPGGSFLVANNLSEGVPATMRTNMGLGTAAVEDVVDLLTKAGNLSGLASAATARTNLGVAIGTDVQAFSAFLAGLVTAGPGAANLLAYLTAANTWALTSFTAFARSFVGAGSNYVAKGVLSVRNDLIGNLTAVDLNTAGDTLIPIMTQSAGMRYRVRSIVLENASISLTTATAGVFTSAGGIGTVAADQALSAATTADKFVALTISGLGLTDVLTGIDLYFRVGTPQGAAATGNLWLFGEILNS